MTTVSRWSPNKVRARVLDGTWVSPEELGGMVLLTPTSVDITGGGSETATTNPNGSVEFTACGTVGLNGVFTTDYDNYMIAITWETSSGSQPEIYFNYRTSGSDAGGTDYTWQYLLASSTSVTGARTSSTSQIRLGTADSSAEALGTTIYIYGPALAQPTASRNVGADGRPDVRIFDIAGTHSLSTAYDGIRFTSYVDTITGLVSVFGLVGA